MNKIILGFVSFWVLFLGAAGGITIPQAGGIPIPQAQHLPR